MPEIPKSDLDVHIYKEDGKYHFTILKLMQGTAGSSSPVYDSKLDNRAGYGSKEEAHKAGMKKMQDM